MLANVIDYIKNTCIFFQVCRSFQQTQAHRQAVRLSIAVLAFNEHWESFGG